MNKSRLVYSTAFGRVDRPTTPAGGGAPVGHLAPNDGVVRLFRERGGRRGKVVTVIRGLPGDGTALLALAAELRRLCGAGGTVKGDAVEIQGDHRERVAEWLRSLGYTVKLAGG